MWLIRDMTVSSPSRCPGMNADDAVFALSSMNLGSAPAVRLRTSVSRLLISGPHCGTVSNI